MCDNADVQITEACNAYPNIDDPAKLLPLVQAHLAGKPGAAGPDCKNDTDLRRQVDLKCLRRLFESAYSTVQTRHLAAGHAKVVLWGQVNHLVAQRSFLFLKPDAIYAIVQDWMRGLVAADSPSQPGLCSA